jgi:hypothetical protein
MRRRHQSKGAGMTSEDKTQVAWANFVSNLFNSLTKQIRIDHDVSTARAIAFELMPWVMRTARYPDTYRPTVNRGTE